MKKWISILLLLAAAFGCAACGSSPDVDSNANRWTYAEPTTETTVETEPPAVLMVITADKLNVRSGPGKEYDIVGELRQGDRVEVFETDGGWGRTDGGWISLDYAREFVPGVDDATEPKNNIDTSDFPYLGDWYILEHEGDDEYWIHVLSYHEYQGYGLAASETYEYHAGDSDAEQWDGSEWGFTYDGVYYTTDFTGYNEDLEINKYKFKDYFKDGMDGWTKGDIEDAMEEANKHYAKLTKPTEPPTEATTAPTETTAPPETQPATQPATQPETIPTETTETP